MINQRTRRLFALIGLSFLVLVGRLAVVQLGQHEIWAEEAARLTHRGFVVPYRRGEIRFADGEIAARDVEAYQLTFAYRPFRREHPLGQVAHARTALSLRGVTLREAERNLVRWARELVRLVPADISAFARGAALVTPSVSVPATEEPRDEVRAGRASDLRFYVRGLLGATRREARAIEDRAEKSPTRSYLELLALERGVADEALAVELEADWAASLDHLAFLAAEIARDAGAAEDLMGRSVSTRSPYEALLEALEESRHAVEGAAASALFREAAGFSAGRLEPETLLSFFDLTELRLILRWDERDLYDWARGARARWRASWRDGYALPRLVAELTLDPAFPPTPDRVVSMLGALFGAADDVEAALAGSPRDWRELDALVALADVGDLFRAELPEGFAPAGVLPFQRADLRGVDPWEWLLLDEVRLGPDGARPASAAGDLFPGAWGDLWRESLEGRRSEDRERRFALARELVDGWEAAFQEAVAATLAQVASAAEPDDLGPKGALYFRRGRLERVAERAAYIQKDYGMRERVLVDEPSYDVVYLLAERFERYPGFRARDARRRERVVLTGDERPLADRLLGGVARADVRAMQRQRAEERRFHELRKKPSRTAAEEDELAALVETVLLPDEVGGVAGLEGFFDPELRGQNGYREIRGQADVHEASFARPAIDGADLTLTLHASLQRAAERVINSPTRPVDDPDHDPAWYRSPVGAIVLLAPDGDVLAAASAPVVELGLDPFAGAEMQPALERTLRRPTFTPPGSVFKPFVAAWALDRMALDPHATVDCTVMADGRVGYVDVRCWNRLGHHHVDLHDALMGSCNAYFAHLGEGFSMADFRGVADAFGFGAPTGIATPPGELAQRGKRNVRLEDASSYLFQRGLTPAERRRAGNGLAVVEATPMQVARATAGLATGVLPDLRVVSSVGGRPIERAPAERVPISEASLRRVREAMVSVTNQLPGGTAARVLNADELGFVLAAKTGSADLVGRKSRDGDGRVRKHTWVAGWAPADQPELIVCAFVHDTSATSSHGAVYIAAEILRDPAVRTYLALRGAELEEPK